VHQCETVQSNWLGWLVGLPPFAYRLDCGRGRPLTTLDPRRGRAVGSRRFGQIALGCGGSHGVQESRGDLGPSDEERRSGGVECCFAVPVDDQGSAIFKASIHSELPSAEQQAYLD